MFDNTNPYTIRFEETDGRKRYFVAFTDGQGNFQETEVSKAVYMEFCHFIKRERNLRRSDERHLEQSELTEETLCRRAVHKPKREYYRADDEWSQRKSKTRRLEWRICSVWILFERQSAFNRRK